MENMIGLLACMLVAATSKSGRGFAAFLFAYYVAYIVLMSVQGSAFDPIGEVQIVDHYANRYLLTFAAADAVFLSLLVVIARRGKVNTVLAVSYGVVILSNIFIGCIAAIHQSVQSQGLIELHADRQALALYIDTVFLIMGTSTGGKLTRMVSSMFLYRIGVWCNIVRISTARLFFGEGRIK